MSKSWEEIPLKTLGVRGPTNDSRRNRAAGWKCGHRHMLTSLRLLQNRCAPQVLPLLLLSAPSWQVPAGTPETKPRENWLWRGRCLCLWAWAARLGNGIYTQAKP